MEKLLIVMLLVSNSCFGMGVWNRVKQWFTQTPQERLECPEFRDFPQIPVEPFLFQELPTDMKQEILLSIAAANNIEVATDTLRAFLATSKLQNILSNPTFYTQLINLMAKNYGILPQLVHLYVGTKMERLMFENDIQKDPNIAARVFQQAKYLNNLLNSVKSYDVLKMISNTARKLKYNNKWQTCSPIWLYSDKSFLCYHQGYFLDGSLSIARLDDKGELDTTFGGVNLFDRNRAAPAGTIVIPRNTSLIDSGIQSDGKIIIALHDRTQEKFILIRFNSNGTLDTTFGENGIITTAISATREELVPYLMQKLQQKNISGNLFINPKNDYIVFKFRDATTHYSAQGKKIK